VSNGAEELRQLGAVLKGTDKLIRKETLDSLKATTAPLGDAVSAEASSILPQRGGLAAKVAASRVTAKIRTSGRQAGVRLVAKGRLEIDPIDRGIVRHPLFGNTSHWYGQSVLPGWWSRPITDAAPRIAEDLSEAIGAALKRAVQ